METETKQEGDKMVPWIKEAWCAWLENPKRQQCQGVLKHVNTEGGSRYCCLGGLEELFQFFVGESEWATLSPEPDTMGIIPEDTLGVGALTTTVNELGYKAVLSHKCMAWAGLTQTNPIVEVLTDDYPELCSLYAGRSQLVALSRLNDAGAPFTKIAALIREQL